MGGHSGIDHHQVIGQEIRAIRTIPRHPFAAFRERNAPSSQAGKPRGPRSRAIAAPPVQVTAQQIGARVRAARLAAQLTQQELAGTTYSKSYISAVERGRMTPSLQALSVLAERLGVTCSSLFGEDMREPPMDVPEAPAEAEEQTAKVQEAQQLVQAGRFEAAIALFGQRDLLAWAREAYAQFLADQGRYQDAYEQMRLACQG